VLGERVADRFVRHSASVKRHVQLAHRFAILARRRHVHVTVIVNEYLERNKKKHRIKHRTKKQDKRIRRKYVALHAPAGNVFSLVEFQQICVESRAANRYRSEYEY
jgi:hypothetical protein